MNMSVKRAFARGAVGTLCVAGTSVCLGATPAQATDDYYNGTNLNCYSQYVIVASTSTGTTDQAHQPVSGGLKVKTYANGSTYRYRISSFYKNIDEVLVTTPGQISSASRFCDN